MKCIYLDIAHGGLIIRRLVLATFPLLTVAATAQAGSMRTLEGTVVDGNHKPIAGASVQVQNEDTKAVESFLTDRVGHFTFHRISANTDYMVMARFHGHDSKSHEISKFNSKSPVVVELEVEAE